MCGYSYAVSVQTYVRNLDSPGRIRTAVNGYLPQWSYQSCPKAVMIGRYTTGLHSMLSCPVIKSLRLLSTGWSGLGGHVGLVDLVEAAGSPPDGAVGDRPLTEN